MVSRKERTLKAPKKPQIRRTANKGDISFIVQQQEALHTHVHYCIRSIQQLIATAFTFWKEYDILPVLCLELLVKNATSKIQGFSPVQRTAHNTWGRSHHKMGWQVNEKLECYHLALETLVENLMSIHKGAKVEASTIKNAAERVKDIPIEVQRFINN